MKVTFHHPPPVQQGNVFDPTDPNHYPTCPGIYIYGLRIDIDEQGKKFVPLYVGISARLKERVFQHYNEEKSAGRSKKEMFDFSAAKFSCEDIQRIYNEMMVYDILTNRIKKGNVAILQTPTVYYLAKLIYFQNAEIYEHKFGILCKGDLSQLKAYNHLVYHGQRNYADKIQETKKKFDNDYYFIYTCLNDNEHVSGVNESKYSDYKTKWHSNGKANGPGKNLAERIELTTKFALNKININTTAKADGKIEPMEIDLSKVQDCLINMGSHPFNDTNGDYITSLIIPMF